MNSSPALKWALALLLVLTVGWKLGLRPNPNDHPIEMQDAIVKFLDQNRFHAVVISDMLNDMHVITAVSGDCRLLIANILPLRDSIDQVQYLTNDAGTSFVVFRGRLYKKQPVILTAINYLWFRILGSLGIASHMPPVLAVVASCDVEQLPWSALSHL